MGMATTPPSAPAALSIAASTMPWVARVGWLLVAVLGGSAVEGAVGDRSSEVRWVAALGGWGVWAVMALALAVASVRSLTAVRVGTPLALVAALAAALAGATATEIAMLGLPAVVTCGAVMSAEFGRQFVQASAYGDEERFPLRVPAPAGAAAVVSWLAWAPAAVAGPFLLASGSWIVGTALSVVAVAGAVFLGPRWNRLSQRWFVLVPAGLVVHDPVVLADTLPLRRAQVKSLRLAPADTAAADFTGPASGHAIEVATSESITAVHAFTPAEPNGRAVHLTAFLVAPSRPGAALRAAGARGLPVT
jgi:hypothetical protein